ncbi:hypothetical protein [Natronoglomus mannanivorans]|uniref:Uncharacterized protein n=1 Tax=Natronoglomus mannanivorans TaxID=2979990 RepID=A0AAP2Z2A5_9EURY|nr:hypothetical protein [Halobacteria archaeon AArc-xg1-1]
MSTDSTAREIFEDVDPDPDAVLEAYGAQTPEELVASGGDHEPTIDDELDADDAAADALFGDLSEDSLEGSALEREPATRSEAGARSSRSESETNVDADAVPTIDWTGDTETTVDADVVVIEPSVTVQEGDGRDVEHDGTVLERVLEDGVDTVAARLSVESMSGSDSGSDASADTDAGTVAGADTEAAIATDTAWESSSNDASSTNRSSTNDLTLVGPEPDEVRIDNTAFGAEFTDFVWFGDSSSTLEADW